MNSGWRGRTEMTYTFLFIMTTRALVLATAASTLQSVAASAQAQVDWGRLGSAWREFVEYPSSDNAKAVAALLPTDHVAYGSNPVSEPIYAGLPMLARQVEARDREAVRLAFALFAVADTDFWEQLDIMLGKLIRIDPQLFLEELSPKLDHAVELDGLVGNQGDAYIDRMKAQCLDLRLRARALEGVTQPDLSTAKERCLVELQKQIQRVCE
jgi:hypothetical protein